MSANFLTPIYTDNTPTLIGQAFIDRRLCSEMIEAFERLKEKHVIAHSTRGYTYLTSLQMPESLINRYNQELSQVLNTYTEVFQYSKETIAAFEQDKHYNIQRYSPNHHYSAWHCENNGESPFSNRHLAFMTYLNDVEIGGETEFLYQKLKIKPKTGLTLIWPAYFTHTHRGLPAPTETKYVTTGWFTFFDTKKFLEDVESMNDEDFYASLNTLTSNVA